MAYFRRQLCFQVRLAGLGKTAAVPAFQQVAAAIDQGHHAARRLAPARVRGLFLGRFGMHAHHDTVQGNQDRFCLLRQFFLLPEAFQDIVGTRLHAGSGIPGQSHQGRHRGPLTAQFLPHVLALAGCQVAHQVQREARRGRRQPAGHQAEEGFGRDQGRTRSRGTVPRPQEVDRSEERHRTARRGRGLAIGFPLNFDRLAMIVKRSERVGQDGAGHAEEHVPELALGRQRITAVHRRHVPRQAELGGFFHQGGTRLHQGFLRRFDGHASIGVLGNRGVNLYVGHWSAPFCRPVRGVVEIEEHSTPPKKPRPGASASTVIVEKSRPERLIFAKLAESAQAPELESENTF